MPDMLGVPACSFGLGQLSNQADAGWKWVGLVAATAALGALEAPCQVQKGGDPPASSSSGQGQQAACASKVTPPIGDNTGPKP